MENPTLADFIASVPELGAREIGSVSFERWHRIFLEHMVNRHRAVADNLHPKMISEYGSRLRKHLAAERMDSPEAEAANQLRRALVAGDEHWQREVLYHLGLDLKPELGITSLHRSVLVHVFRLRNQPSQQFWDKTPPETLTELVRWGYINNSHPGMKLTEEGLAASGVLFPRVRYNDENGFYTVGPEAYGALIGPMRRGQQAVVKLLEVTHF